MNFGQTLNLLAVAFELTHSSTTRAGATSFSSTSTSTAIQVPA